MSLPFHPPSFVNKKKIKRYLYLKIFSPFPEALALAVTIAAVSAVAVAAATAAAEVPFWKI